MRCLVPLRVRRFTVAGPWAWWRRSGVVNGGGKVGHVGGPTVDRHHIPEFPPQSRPGGRRRRLRLGTTGPVSASLRAGWIREGQIDDTCPLETGTT